MRILDLTNSKIVESPFPIRQMADHVLPTSLSEIIEFLGEHTKKGSPPVQIRILLRGKTKDVSVKLNEFLVETEIEPEEKIDIAVESLGMLSELEQRLPGDTSFNIQRMKYSAFANFLRNHLVAAYSHSDVARNYSTASILSNLLIDEIIHIEKIPELPEYSNPDRYSREFGPIFNVLVSTIGVYNSLISTLSVISKNDIEVWFTRIFDGIKLFKELLKQYNVIALLSSRKVQDMNKFMNNAFNIANTYFGQIENFLLLTQFYGTNIPKPIIETGIIEDGKLSDFIHIINNIIKENEKIVEDLDEAKKKHLLSANDNYEDVMFYGNYVLNVNSANFYISLYKIYQDRTMSDINLIDDFIDQVNSKLNKLVEMVGEREHVVDSAAVSVLLEDMMVLLPMIALSAVLKEDPTIFTNFTDEWSYFFEKYSFDKSTEMGYIFLISKLYLNTKLNQNINYSDISRKIEKNLHFTELRSRMYVSLCILKLVIDAKMNKSLYGQEKFISKMYEIGIPDKSSWYHEEVKQFISYLKGERDYHDLDHRKEIIPMDIHSWLIPNFNSNDNQIQFLPFNRQVDSIV